MSARKGLASPDRDIRELTGPSLPLYFIRPVECLCAPVADLVFERLPAASFDGVVLGVVLKAEEKPWFVGKHDACFFYASRQTSQEYTHAPWKWWSYNFWSHAYHSLFLTSRNWNLVISNLKPELPDQLSARWEHKVSSRDHQPASVFPCRWRSLTWSQQKTAVVALTQQKQEVHRLELTHVAAEGPQFPQFLTVSSAGLFVLESPTVLWRLNFHGFPEEKILGRNITKAAARGWLLLVIDSGELKLCNLAVQNKPWVWKSGCNRGPVLDVQWQQASLVIRDETFLHHYQLQPKGLKLVQPSPRLTPPEPLRCSPWAARLTCDLLSFLPKDAGQIVLQYVGMPPCSFERLTYAQRVLSLPLYSALPQLPWVEQEPTRAEIARDGRRLNPLRTALWWRQGQAAPLQVTLSRENPESLPTSREATYWLHIGDHSQTSFVTHTHSVPCLSLIQERLFVAQRALTATAPPLWLEWNDTKQLLVPPSMSPLGRSDDPRIFTTSSWQNQLLALIPLHFADVGCFVFLNSSGFVLQIPGLEPLEWRTVTSTHPAEWEHIKPRLFGDMIVIRAQGHTLVVAVGDLLKEMLETAHTV